MNTRGNVFVGCVVWSTLVFGGLSRPLYSGQAANQVELMEVHVGESVLEVKRWGTGEPLVMMSAGGQSAERFNVIAPIVAEAGYTVFAVNRRGIGGSTGPLEGLTLHDYAGDIADVIRQLGPGKAHILGWAYGNRVARTVATDHPEIVRSVTLLAAGGKVPPTEEAAEALRELRRPDLTDAQAIPLIGAALFSPHSDARLWLAERRRWPESRRAERNANAATPVDEWWGAGSAPMLVVQGLDDATAPPENARLLKKEYGERVELVEIDRAGHALVLERPDVVANAVVTFLRKHPVQ